MATCQAMKPRKDDVKLMLRKHMKLITRFQLLSGLRMSSISKGFCSSCCGAKDKALKVKGSVGSPTKVLHIITTKSPCGEEKDVNMLDEQASQGGSSLD
ncbi:hypothetical protein QQ045_009628 [Rhodiola kirilowii]